MGWRVPAIVALAAVLPRAAAALIWPESGGDWDIYSTVAENILAGCGVSLSDPAGGDCVAHFGGNQGPGYPAFVAAVWWLGGHSDMAVRLAQAVLYALALGWLVRAVQRIGAPAAAALAVGLVMALSPLQAAWPRFTQTETLALATTVWVLAELVLSVADGRLRLLPLGLALIAATFIRLDGVLLTVPVATAAFLLHPPGIALRRGVVVALILALPWAGWTARNVAVELPSAMPQQMVGPDPTAPAPWGYLAWGDTWVVAEYQRPGYLWPVTRYVYEAIEIDPNAYASDAERARVESLLAELRHHSGAPFPPHIDAAFAEIAADRRAAPGNSAARLFLRRAFALWSNPFSSFGWPAELPGRIGHDTRLKAAQGGIGGLLALAKDYPGQSAAKAVVAGYRFILLGLFVVVVLLSLRPAVARVSDPTARIAWLALAIVLARTLFFAWTNNVETRYTVEAVPGMELAVVLWLAALSYRRRARPPAG